MKKRTFITLFAAILAAAQLSTFCGCGNSGTQNTAETESTEERDEAGIIVIDTETDEPANYDEDSEAYQEAKEAYESLLEYKEEYLLENFETMQEDSYDENTSRFYADPETQANLPEEFSETALSLQENEVGMTGKTDYGYFVIMRVAFDEDDLTNIKNDMINERFNEQLTDLASEAEIQEAEILSEVDFTAWMENLSELQTAITDEYSSLSAESTDAVEIEEQLLATLPEAAKEDCVAYLTDGVMDKDTTVMTVNGTEVKAGVFFYMLTYYKMTDYGTDAISESYLTIAMNQAKADLVNDVIALNLAQENGVELSEEETASNEEVLDNTLVSSLLYQGCNEDALEDLLNYTSHGNAYAAKVYGEGGEYDIPLDEVYAYAEENGYYTCRYIWYYEDNTDSD